MSIQGFYAGQDAFTDPSEFVHLYDDLPKSPAGLRDIVSQLIIHVAWATRYEISPDVPMSRETQAARERLRLGISLHPESLCKKRRPDQRSFGTCRDYAIMLCSMLRHHSIPARIRCGFATYFTACPFEDHWICEFWSPHDSRWVRADAQLDQVHRDQLGIGFDAADLPDNVFLAAARAWRVARNGGVVNEAFGHGETRGLWFIRVNVYRDLLALTNQPVSAWDTWRSATTASKALDGAVLAEVDSVAAVIGDFEAGADRFDVINDIASRSQRPPWQD